MQINKAETERICSDLLPARTSVNIRSVLARIDCLGGSYLESIARPLRQFRLESGEFSAGIASGADGTRLSARRAGSFWEGTGRTGADGNRGSLNSNESTRALAVFGSPAAPVLQKDLRKLAAGGVSWIYRETKHLWLHRGAPESNRSYCQRHRTWDGLP